MRNYMKLLFTIAFVAGLWAIAQAQPGGGGGFGDDPNDVPIDGGLSILVGAGVAYGAKKIHDRKKQNKNKEV